MKLRIRLLFVASMITVVIIVCAKEGKRGDQSIMNTGSPPPDTVMTVCPANHSDDIIPIIYGLPTAESFQKEDSGLIQLAGCEMTADSPLWYCKRHDLRF